MMTTSAFRIPLDLLGKAYAYPLTPQLMEAFDQISRRWRNRADNEHARAPYASLATALSAVTGQPVMILRRPRTNADPHWLITTSPIDPSTLRIATRVWERQAREGQDANVLAPLLSSITPLRLDVAEDVNLSVPGHVSASNWVFRVLGWNLARSLASTPVQFDSRSVPFRLDTDGALVAWDDPIPMTLGNMSTARGIVKISLAVKTLPGVGDLVCVPTISFTRLVNDLKMVKSGWVDHGRSSGGSALLRLPIATKKVDGEWTHVFRDFSGAVVEACGLSPIPWGEDVLTEHPDRVRAWRSVNWAHPLGTGVGTRTYLRFLEHATAIPGVEPITYQPTKIKVRKAVDKTPINANALDTAVRSAGHEKLRIVHLSAWSATRERVRQALGAYQSENASPLLPHVGVIQTLTPKCEVIAYDVTDLLQHGKIDRSELLAPAPLLKGEPGTLVLALVDTVHEKGKSALDDAKLPIRYSLAKLGIPTQFIAVAPGADGSRPKPSRKPKKDVDYPVVTAVRDLMRAGGLTDDRLSEAVSLKPHPLNGDAWLVGIHVRAQNGNGSNGRLLVNTMVAVHARKDADRPWKILMYVRGQGWIQHAAGLAAYHSAAIGTPLDNEQSSYAKLRGYVDSALGELPGDDPVIVMTDADETRRVWGGLSDGWLREGVLPGDGLANAREICVVRVGTSDEAVPRPVDYSDGKQPEDPRKPASPRNRIYELRGDDGTRSWLLGQASRTFNEGSEGRVGADFTRFTLPAEREKEQGNPWHAFTGTEFVVVRTGLFDEDAAVAVTARLCAQPLSWDAQTRWPVPLHLANIADEDHPGYRTEQNDL
ncbi:RNaseH domain-containing protein [Nonomuraea sp. H19]|uniref:RNaseH domain-containing protein n=1 Tax=Nonomuraea sp. H19 TaxID=3452206 RepID=UPI003F8879DD